MATAHQHLECPGQNTAGVCPATRAPCPGNGECTTSIFQPLSLADALERFRQEAVRGDLDTGRYRCSFFSWGEGPPVVFIPGLADDSLSFVPMASALASQFRCVAYDLPCGRGDGARMRTYTHPHLVDDLFALLDHLGLRQSYLFGSSFGSTVALAALHRAPDRLPRAILQGGFARRPLTIADALLARTARYWFGSMGRLPFRRSILRRNHHAPFAGRPAEFWDYFLTRSNAPPIAGVAYRAILLHRTDLRPILSEIRQPVLLVCGDADPLVGPDCEAALLGGLPNAGRLTLAGCGHCPLFSHPEILAEAVRRFLTPSV